ncbi:MAG: hypothetical protein K2X61_04740 [Caulobacteraceae bacterium]|nr:hypothetical protein [Caulobacteraceae bacterium]
MASKLSTINLAFAHLSEPVVPNLEGDPKPPNVVKALAQFDQALDVCLTKAGWLCALESRVLDPDDHPGDWRYRYRFTCPAGTLKVWAVDGGDDFAWQAGTAVEAGAVTRTIRAADKGPLRVDLIMSRPVEALTPLLADALAWELASRLAGPIQSSEAKARWAAGEAEKAYQLAAGSEATEIGGQEPGQGMGGMTLARLQAGAA